MGQNKGEQALELLISRAEIAEAVTRLARQLESDYPQEMPLLVAVLKGSFVFLADLVREIQRPVEIDFLRLSSYGGGTSSSGSVRLRMGVTTPIRGRDVLLVEDIVDTGLTTFYATRYLKRNGASSVRVCTLLDKPARRQAAIIPDYVGRTVPDRFIVGYGLDFDERYRQLSDIYVMTGAGDGP